jgi:hypothetical protein
MSSTSTVSMLAKTFAASAAASSDASLKTGVTWNGDINYGSLGHDFKSKLLELDQGMVTPSDCTKEGQLDVPTISLFNTFYYSLMETIKSASEASRAKEFELLFRYLFYLRSVRIPGKKSRLLFYYLYERLYVEFPQTCIDLLNIVPEFGYFGDLDQLINHMSCCPKFVKAAEQVYINYLDMDCQLIFGKPLASVTKNEAVELNKQLETMTPEEVKTFVAGKKLSLASKWFKREGKKNSNHRKDILISLYFPNGGITDLQHSHDPKKRELAKKRLGFCQMLFRNIISALTQCLLVPETMMCETNDEHRTWSDISIESAPAKFITKYRKALANEKLKEAVPEHMADTGNRHPDAEDRVVCRQNLLRALLDKKIKGASQDLSNLSKIIFEKINYRTTLSSVERMTISAQWDDIVTKLKEEINKTIDEAKVMALEEGEMWIDPRNVIPVIDTSGSMVGANVQDKAIGLGILASQLSTMPGCLISFSDRPEVFHLDMTKDVFDQFETIARGPMGYSTNIDATYRLLLNLMTSAKVKETDFALLFLTDGQFDSQVMLNVRTVHSYNSYSALHLDMNTFMDRMEIAFRDHGFNLPRTIFWNLNASSPGFPATAISKGVQLVSGFSQSLMLQVFTGDYKFEAQEDGTMKVSVNPWDAFLKALLHQGYDPVSQMIASTGEGCLKLLAKT